jgi:hypothetical protein
MIDSRLIMLTHTSSRLDEAVAELQRVLDVVAQAIETHADDLSALDAKTTVMSPEGKRFL